MGILSEMLAKKKPLDRDTIIALTEDCVLELQENKLNYRARDQLLFLHLGLVLKIANQQRCKLKEDDVLTVCLESIVPAAIKYNVAEGHKRFSWVSFYMQRCKWAINDYFFKTTQIVYIPKVPFEGGLRHEYVKRGILTELINKDAEDDSLPTRWDVAYVYETNVKLNAKQKEELTMFKLAWKNKDLSKIAKRMGVRRKDVISSLERVQEDMTLFFRGHPELIP